MKNNIRSGFTLIEMLVVIAIIGLLATVAVIALRDTKGKANDAARISEIQEVAKAVELFFVSNGRYPDTANDGISDGGEVLGIGNPIDTALAPYMPLVPNDVLWDGTADEATDFFFAYDPTRPDCTGPGISVNSFQTQAAIQQYGRQELTVGTDMFMNTAHYSRCLQE